MGQSEGRQKWLMYCVYIYEYRTEKLSEIVLRKRRERVMKDDGRDGSN
jgi:hypothetical protein